MFLYNIRAVNGGDFTKYFNCRKHSLIRAIYSSEPQTSIVVYKFNILLMNSAQLSSVCLCICLATAGKSGSFSLFPVKCFTHKLSNKLGSHYFIKE